MDQAQLQKMFGGAPGTPVPQVDPEDVRAVWKLGQEVKKNHPGVNVGISVELLNALPDWATQGKYAMTEENELSLEMWLSRRGRISTSAIACAHFGECVFQAWVYVASRPSNNNPTLRPCSWCTRFLSKVHESAAARLCLHTVKERDEPVDGESGRL
jgi:hypothetical protein